MKEIYYTKSGNTFFVHYAYEKKDIFKQLAVVRNEQVAELLVEAYKIEYQITK